MIGTYRPAVYAVVALAVLILCAPLAKHIETGKILGVSPALPPGLIGDWTRELRSERDIAVREQMSFRKDGAWERTIFLDNQLFVEETGVATFVDGTIHIVKKDGKILDLRNTVIDGPDQFSCDSAGGDTRLSYSRYTKKSSRVAEITT